MITDAKGQGFQLTRRLVINSLNAPSRAIERKFRTEPRILAEANVILPSGAYECPVTVADSIMGVGQG